jgi:hypothetical protein
MATRLSRSQLLVASALLMTGTVPAASFAQDASPQLGAIEKQIQALQAELRHMKGELAARDRQLRSARVAPAPVAPPPVTQPAPVYPQIPAGYALVPAPGSTSGSVVLAQVLPPPKPLPQGQFKVGGVTIQLGGFFEAAGLYRSRTTPTDIVSSFTATPERNLATYHEPQFVESARQSRLQALITANPDEVTKLQAFFATDFLGAAPTANYNESNSWTPRIREGFITYARSDYGFYVLGGQTWTLLTANRVGVDPTKIALPLEIDPQYVVGLNWARQSQFRIAKNLGSDQFWAALSIENASTVVAGTAPTIEGKTINVSNAGAGVDATGNNITNNFAPDVVGKLTADFPIAHLEAYGVGRVFNDRVSQVGGGTNYSQFAGGAGGAAIIHVIPTYVDLQLSGLAGRGIGRYGTSQLPDVTYNAQGKESPLPGYEALAGLVGHVTPDVDLYAYFGVEHVSARYGDTGTAAKPVAFGYGNPLYNNTGCETELSTVCAANTSGTAELTFGEWWKFVHSKEYGTMQVGTQYSYERRYVFQGEGPTPKTDENLFYVSFRWYPFSF